MKKNSLISFLFSFFSLYGFSQRDVEMPERRTIESLKVAYITKQLILTPDEAQKFWPVYNMYVNELKAARKERKDDQDVLALEESVLVIRKKYKGDFKKTLMADDRVNKVLTIDRDFSNVLRKELQQRMQMRNKLKRIPDKI